MFELAPLRRRDVLLALTAHQIDPDTFVPDLFAAHAVPFAIKPLTLGILIKIHQRHGSLPSSVAEVYRQGCLALAEEQNVSRRETKRLGRLNGPQRFRLACRVAAGTVIGGRAAVWTGPEADCPAEELPISRLSGARKKGISQALPPPTRTYARCWIPGCSAPAATIAWAGRTRVMASSSLRCT